MRTMSNVIAGLTVLGCGLGTIAYAQDSYQINVNRVQGTVSCQIVTGSNYSENCTTNVEGQSNLTITMNQNANIYAGGDSVSVGPNGGKYILALVADANKSLRDVILMEGQSAGQTFEGYMTLTAATSLKALNIEPLQVLKSDTQHIQVQLSFVEYEPASATSQPTIDKQALTQTIMAKVRPLVALSK